jgi:hypothetical protein
MTLRKQNASRCSMWAIFRTAIIWLGFGTGGGLKESILIPSGCKMPTSAAPGILIVVHTEVSTDCNARRASKSCMCTDDPGLKKPFISSSLCKNHSHRSAASILCSASSGCAVLASCLNRTDGLRPCFVCVAGLHSKHDSNFGHALLCIVQDLLAKVFRSYKGHICGM